VQTNCNSQLLSYNKKSIIHPFQDRFKTQIELAAEQAEMFRLLEEKRLSATAQQETTLLQNGDSTSTHDGTITNFQHPHIRSF
jgi:hypothetical protein